MAGNWTSTFSPSAGATLIFATDTVTVDVSWAGEDLLATTVTGVSSGGSFVPSSVDIGGTSSGYSQTASMTWTPFAPGSGVGCDLIDSDYNTESVGYEVKEPPLEGRISFSSPQYGLGAKSIIVSTAHLNLGGYIWTITPNASGASSGSMIWSEPSSDIGDADGYYPTAWAAFGEPNAYDTYTMNFTGVNVYASFLADLYFVSTPSTMQVLPLAAAGNGGFLSF